MYRALICIGIVLSFTPSVSALPTLSAVEKGELNAGEVVVRERSPRNGKGVAFEAFGIIRNTPDSVWPVLRDCGRFQEFLPRTKKSEMRNRVGNTVVCFTEIAMPFPFDNLWADVKVSESVHGGGEYSRTWSLIRGTYEWNDGSWRLYPWNGGKQSLLVYRLAVNPKISVPDFLIRKGQTGALPDLYEALNGRVR